MPDYKEMYLKLFRASEQAIGTLIQAQKECEALYLNQTEPEKKVVCILSKSKNSREEE